MIGIGKNHYKTIVTKAALASVLIVNAVAIGTGGHIALARHHNADKERHRIQPKRHLLGGSVDQVGSTVDQVGRELQEVERIGVDHLILNYNRSVISDNIDKIIEVSKQLASFIR